MIVISIKQWKKSVITDQNDFVLTDNLYYENSGECQLTFTTIFPLICPSSNAIHASLMFLKSLNCMAHRISAALQYNIHYGNKCSILIIVLL